MSNNKWMDKEDVVYTYDGILLSQKLLEWRFGSLHQVGWHHQFNQRTWVWADSRRWWRTGEPGMLQSMRSQRMGHNRATELNWTGLNRWKWKWKSLCPVQLPIDYIVHGIIKARILEWVAIPFYKVSCQPRDWTLVSCIAGRFFTMRATWEAWSPKGSK